MKIAKSIGKFGIIVVVGIALGAIVCACGNPGIIPQIGDVFTVPFPG